MTTREMPLPVRVADLEIIEAVAVNNSAGRPVPWTVERALDGAVTVAPDKAGQWWATLLTVDGPGEGSFTDLLADHEPQDLVNWACAAVAAVLPALRSGQAVTFAAY